MGRWVLFYCQNGEIIFPFWQKNILIVPRLLTVCGCSLDLQVSTGSIIHNEFAFKILEIIFRLLDILSEEWNVFVLLTLLIKGLFSSYCSCKEINGFLWICLDTCIEYCIYISWYCVLVHFCYIFWIINIFWFHKERCIYYSVVLL